MTVGFRALQSAAGLGFDPLSIPWADAYWAQGPLFRALGLSDGGAVTTWPSEVSGSLSSVGTAAPVYRATGINGKPAVQAVGTSNLYANGASLAQPWTFVVVGLATTTASRWGGAAQADAANGGLARASFAAGVSLAYTDIGSALHLIEAVANGASSAVNVDGASVATGDAGTSANARRELMARSGSSGTTSPLTGYIAFAAYIGRALTSTEKANLLAWSRSFYGTP